MNILVTVVFILLALFCLYISVLCFKVLLKFIFTDSASLRRSTEHAGTLAQAIRGQVPFNSSSIHSRGMGIDKKNRIVTQSKLSDEELKILLT